MDERSDDHLEGGDELEGGNELEGGVESEAGAEAFQRERRSSAQVHTALIKAAATLFAQHGMARTTTREIAQTAGVAENALFRHFGSKAELFREAVVGPFAAFADQYVQRWWPILDTATANEAVLRAFMEDLYDELLENRDAVRALLLAHGDPAAAEAVAEGQQHLSGLFRALTELAESWSARSDGMSGVFTEELTSRFIVGMLMLFTTFDWWFAPPGESPVAKAHVIDVMASMVIPGLALAPPQASGSASAPGDRRPSR